MNQQRTSVPPEFAPQPVTLDLPCDATDIRAVQRELQAKAQNDDNKCWGYFPAMGAAQGIDAELPQSQRFAGEVSAFWLRGKEFRFSFTRLSLVQQVGSAPYHLDTDAATALAGNIQTISKRLVWRLLLNLNAEYPRSLGYLDIDSSNAPIGSRRGYLHYDGTPPADRARSVSIPPREGTKVHGVLFCASRVLHTGQDDEHGHFVAGYGCETAA